MFARRGAAGVKAQGEEEDGALDGIDAIFAHHNFNATEYVDGLYTTSASADELFVHESKLAVAARLAAERLALGAHSQAAAFATAARRMRAAGCELGAYHGVLADLDAALQHLNGCCANSLDTAGAGAAPSQPAEALALEIDADFANVLDRIDAALRDEDAEEAAGLACKAQRRKRPAAKLLAGRVAATEALVKRADFAGSERRRFGFMRTLRSSVDDTSDGFWTSLDAAALNDAAAFRDDSNFEGVLRPRAAILLALGKHDDAVRACLDGYSCVLQKHTLAELFATNRPDDELFAAELGDLCRRYWRLLATAVTDFTRLFSPGADRGCLAPRPQAALALVEWAQGETCAFAKALWIRASTTRILDDGFALVIASRVGHLALVGSETMAKVGLPLDVVVADALAPKMAQFLLDLDPPPSLEDFVGSIHPQLGGRVAKCFTRERLDEDL